MKKIILKDDTVTDTDLKKVDNFPIYPRDSEITTDKGFLNNHKASLRETHWIYFSQKIMFPITLIPLVDTLIKLHSNNYRNQSFSEFKISVVDYAAATILTFSI